MKYRKSFLVKPGSQVKLDKIDARYTAEHESHQHALAQIEKHCAKLRDLQYLMYAEDKRSLLICLRAMDASGKDGTVNHVLGASWRAWA
jgi:polyphosphate kinase 2 (PPK2 family)